MSRATIIDEREEDQTETTDTLESFDQPEEVVEEAPQEPELPEKYRNKSLEDIVHMHQEAEKMLGKQSSEVGELRKVVDDYIQAQLSQQAPVQQQDEEDDIDFFTDPKSAVSRAIENHPKIRQAEQYARQSQQQATLAQLQADHPDMQQILNDPKFAEWVKGSKIRTQLFVQADQQYDYDAANELFSTWKERNNMAQQTAEVEKQARKQQLKSASTGNARGTGEATRKKVYRRADIIKLMNSDPDRYMALQPEIMAAYAEGRVK